MGGKLACGLALVLTGLIACGESDLFGSAGVGTGAGGGDATGGGSTSSDGGASSMNTGGSAAGPSTGGATNVGGGPNTGGGGGDGGDDGWVQPDCNPPCDIFSVCCDKGDGSPPACVNNATGCKCDVTKPDASCGGFADNCCAAPGDTIGSCSNSRIGCACNPDAGCGVTNTCCDKGNGGPECSQGALECLCGADPEVCDFFYDTCCDKGDGERCYQNSGGCM